MKTELGVIVLFGAVFLLVMMARMHEDIRPSSVQRRAFAGSRPRPSRDPVAPPKAPEAPVDYDAYVSGLIQRLSKPSPRYRDQMALTMQSPARLRQLQRLIEQMVDAGVCGDVYETGTWRAGTSIFMVLVFRAYGRSKNVCSSRHFYFFDSFAGFRPEGIDESLDAYLSKQKYVAPLETVRASFADFDVDMRNITFVKGFFDDTVPPFNVPGPIAMLRMDGDLYSSTKVVLDHFYDYVVPRGWVIIDDYDWRPSVSSSKLCREAVDEFRAARQIVATLTYEYGPPSWQVPPKAPEAPREVKIHDTFIFNSEFERLAWRFEEYWDVVDRFHVFESTVSHQGHKKPLRFRDNQSIFDRYKSKITVHEIAPLDPETCKKTPYTCEMHDRQFMRAVLEAELRDDDIVIMTDADEIIRNDVLHEIRAGTIVLPVRVETPVWKYSLHWKDETRSNWNEGCVFAFGTPHTDNWNSVRRDHTRQWNTVRDAGWHLSTFGDVDTIYNKLQFMAAGRLRTREDIEARLRRGQAMYSSTEFFAYKTSINHLPRIATTRPNFYANKFWRYPRAAPPALPVRTAASRLHDMIHDVDASLCAESHTLKGENDKEPDLHICLDHITPPCVVYSFGIAYNWIFDDYMVGRGCHVFSFDPSMNVSKHYRSPTHLFEPIGIGVQDGLHTGASTLYGKKTDYPVLTLESMMQRYNHTHIDLVRMDVESAEWSVLRDWTRKKLWKRMDQLLMEIHMWGSLDSYASTLEDIPLRRFYRERNRWNGQKIYKDTTRVYELGYLRTWTDPFTGGGMSKAEQTLLRKYYENATRIFEWGMGSSTSLAAYLHKSIVAVDSALVWVQKCRQLFPGLDLRHADIGPVKDWGAPKSATPTEAWADYSRAVDAEEDPFDVYLVDGRFRVASAARALLHNPDGLVMVHDAEREAYAVLWNVTRTVEQVGKLRVVRPMQSNLEVYRRIWNEYKYTTT